MVKAQPFIDKWKQQIEDVRAGKGIALQQQTKTLSTGHCLPFAAGAAGWSSCCGMTGKVCVCLQSGWIMVISSDR
jgi:hypothetical protein